MTRILCALLFSASPVLADLSCNFSEECMEGQSCDSSAFELSIEDGEFVTDTISAAVAHSDATAGIVGSYTSAPVYDMRHYLTVFDGGLARLSIHMLMEDAPVVFVYTGQCEAGS